MYFITDPILDDLLRHIYTTFGNVIYLVTLGKRLGLIGARLEGVKHVTGDVLCFLDSHMEVNIDWYVLLETAVNRSFHIIPSRFTRNSREQIISHYPLTYEKIQDTKRIIKSRKAKKNGQYNGQKEKMQMGKQRSTKHYAEN